MSQLPAHLRNITLDYLQVPIRARFVWFKYGDHGWPGKDKSRWLRRMMGPRGTLP